LDTQKLRELLDRRDAIDAEIAEAATLGDARSVKVNRKPQACSVCGDAGHSARTCPKKEPAQL
jgi:hypothetical protein